MFTLSYSDTPPQGHTFEFDARTGILQCPDGSLQTAEIITPDLKGDAPFVEFGGGLLVSIIDGVPNFAVCA